jgi:Fic family protein
MKYLDSRLLKDIEQLKLEFDSLGYTFRGRRGLFMVIERDALRHSEEIEQESECPPSQRRRQQKELHAKIQSISTYLNSIVLDQIKIDCARLVIINTLFEPKARRNPYTGFRTGEVIIPNSRHHQPPACEDVFADVAVMLDDAYTLPEIQHPILRGAYMHYHLNRIHPFSDGNGRTARAINNVLLEQGGYPSTDIGLKEREVYMFTLREADKAYSEKSHYGFIPYFTFMAIGVKKGLEKILENEASKERFASSHPKR